MNIEKINCQKNPDKSYICDYVIDYNITTDEGSLAELVGMKGRKKMVSKSNFLKTSKSWIIADE